MKRWMVLFIQKLSPYHDVVKYKLATLVLDFRDMTVAWICTLLLLMIAMHQ